MNFELLPDEIFLDLFDYFNGTDLIYAFNGLNSRFNWLLYKQYRTYRFNFHSLSKQKFVQICQEHLPFITDRIISFTFSNDDDTPQQIQVFFTYFLSINQFPNLRSLSLLGNLTHKTLMKIMDQCHQLCCLTYFRFNSSYQSYDRIVYQLVLDHIWTLPKLTHFSFNYLSDYGSYIWIPNKISSSIEHLSISEHYIKLDKINYMFQNTPRLQYLSINVHHCAMNYTPCLFPSLIRLNIRVAALSHTSAIISLLQNLPNLRVLDIELLYDFIDAYVLQEIISKYLIKLKIFRFKMTVQVDAVGENKEDQMDELINSFRSPFWIDEHQWFVRCFRCKANIYLYTLPYTLSPYSDYLPRRFLSTDPNDNLQRFCNDITKISKSGLFDYLIPLNIHLTNIEDLHIDFPIHNQFWSIVPQLNRLKSLTIYVNVRTSPSELQALLNRAPNLYELNIKNKEISVWESSVPSELWSIELLKCKHTSIRHLNLDGCLCLSTKEGCEKLAHSSLATKCEVVTLQTDNDDGIVSIINKMINLRVLTVYIDDKEGFSSSLSRKRKIDYDKTEVNVDEMTKRLKDRLPSIYSISSERQRFDKYAIRIWIA